MAEPTSPPAGASRPPALPSTADAQPYVPVSWMAVAAAAVAALFVIVLLVSGYGAYRSKRPLIAPELLLLPAVSIVLCFVAWRMIRNSEGTRTGELFGLQLPRAAAWVSGILFLGYGAYFLAIDYSIRSDAREEVAKWVDLIRTPDDPSAPDPIDLAFLRTIDPMNRGNYMRIPDRAELRKKLQDRYRDELVAFRQTDFIRIAERNRENSQFESGGLRDWVYKENGIECVFTGTFKCPEGTFPLSIPMKGIESGSTAEGGTVGRQWQILPTQGGFIQRDKARFTPYGWMLMSLERSGSEYCAHLVMMSALGPGIRPYIYQLFVPGGQDPQVWCRYLTITPRTGTAEKDVPNGPWFDVFTTLPGAVAVGGSPVVSQPFNAAYQTYLQQKFLRLPGGGEPSAAQREKFLKCWNEERGIVQSAGSIRTNPDSNPTISWTPAAIEVRFPIEIPFPDGTAARGRVVVECTDAAALAELKGLRQSANPDDTVVPEARDVLGRQFPWKLVRVESDMYGIKPMGPGSADQPGGGPPR